MVLGIFDAWLLMQVLIDSALTQITGFITMIIPDRYLRMLDGSSRAELDGLQQVLWSAPGVQLGADWPS